MIQSPRLFAALSRSPQWPLPNETASYAGYNIAILNFNAIISSATVFTGAQNFPPFDCEKAYSSTGSKEEEQQAAWQTKKGSEGRERVSFQLSHPFPSPISTSNTRAVVARNGCS